MAVDEEQWLTLTEASKLLGVHFTTLRRWADAGSVPCFRTPGGHRRFREADLSRWMEQRETAALVPLPESMVQSAVGYTRREMARKDVARESWYAAFEGEEARHEMRDTGRRLFGLALQYMGRTRDREPIVQEGRRIGEFYGRQAAERGVSLPDTVRALFFFRESLLRAAKPGQASPGQYDAEDVRIHRQLRHFMDEVMYACLASFESTYHHLLSEGSAL